MGIDRVKAKTGHRFSLIAGIDGHVQSRVTVALLAASSAAQEVVLARAAATEGPGLVPGGVERFDPVGHGIRS
jgi:hypothetical protein